MDQLLNGSVLVSYFRRLADQDTVDASKYRFQSEVTVSKEKENENVITIEGTRNVVTDGEKTAEFTSIAYVSDEETITMWEQMEEWFDNVDQLEFWLVNTATLDDSTNEVSAKYYRGFFTSFELSAAADGQVELSYTLAIDGKGAKGTDTLSDDQVADLRRANAYDYQSMQAGGSDSGSAPAP